MERMLVVSVNWIGDVIFASPVFRTLRRNYPQAKIVCLAVPRVRDILACCPEIDEIILYDERGRHRGLAGKWEIIQELRRRKLECAFFLRPSWTRTVMTWLAGIPCRVGYGPRRGDLLTVPVRRGCARGAHRADEYLGVVEAVGMEAAGRACALTVPREAEAAVARLLEETGVTPSERIIVVNTGGNWDLKRWPQAFFAELIRRLSEAFEARVVIPGAEQDLPRAEEIASASGTRPVILAGKTSLKGLVALMRRAEVVISNDSGPLHMAAAVGTPVVGIFGPTRPEITGPRGSGPVRVLQHDVGCNRGPCYYLDCPSNLCMQAVGVEEVLAAARALWGRNAQTDGRGAA